MQHTFWHHLLDAYCMEGAGPTLPYLVGAWAMQRGSEASIRDAECILSEMRQHEVENIGYYISYCSKIKAPVFTLLHHYGKGVRVVLGNDWGSGDDEKFRSVMRHSEQPISEGNFSRIQVDGVYCWRPFTAEELPFIAGVIETFELG